MGGGGLQKASCTLQLRKPRHYSRIVIEQRCGGDGQATILRLFEAKPRRKSIGTNNSFWDPGVTICKKASAKEKKKKYVMVWRKQVKHLQKHQELGTRIPRGVETRACTRTQLFTRTQLMLRCLLFSVWRRQDW